MKVAPKNGSEFPDSKLVKLALEDRELNPEETKAVLKHLPLLVLADDEPGILNMAVGIMSRNREGKDSVVGLRGDMAQCFDAAQGFKGEKLPVVLCENGNKAREAVQIICERGIPSGIVALDQKMPGPTGTEIFSEFNGQFSPQIAKILQSSRPPNDVDTYLKAGILDANPGKFSFGTTPSFARIYLQKVLKGSHKSSS